jgi:hypothetical protein
MKSIVAVLAVVATFAGATLAQEKAYFPSADKYTVAAVAKLEKAMTPCLECQNDGVVESALAQIAWAKLNVASYDFSAMRAVLNKLAIYGQTPEIRYKAYLVTLVFDHTELFRDVLGKEYADGTDLFSAISERVRRSLLTLGDRKWAWAQ